jgi:hypothetical protein
LKSSNHENLPNWACYSIQFFSWNQFTKLINSIFDNIKTQLSEFKLLNYNQLSQLIAIQILKYYLFYKVLIYMVGYLATVISYISEMFLTFAPYFSIILFEHHVCVLFM